MDDAVGARFLRVHLSIDAQELSAEAAALGDVLARLRMQAVDDVAACDVFVGVYGDRYGDIDPRSGLSRLERDYLAAGRVPRLVYLMTGDGRRDPHLAVLVSRIQADDMTSYRRVVGVDELVALAADDLAMVLTEAYTEAMETRSPASGATEAPAQPPPAPGSRIPAPWHAIVGRDSEIAEVCALLTGGAARLVTLTGPGGIGKSRLAIEVADRCQDAFAHRAWFVDLSGLHDPALVASSVAHALGVRESAGVLPVESLKTYLAPMHALLLLDSFETVTAAAPLVVDLLAAAPHLAVLVTSRSVLRVRGERDVPLPPLAVPAAGATDGGGSPAYQLFMERVGAIAPRRLMTAAERTAAAAICRRLDGVPLALELAAARSRVLSLTVLLERLEQALDVLGDGPRDLPERQRALRTTLDWDHALLEAAEQVAFRRLAVFPSHVTLAAAEAVVADDVDVLDAMDGLVGKSLLRPVTPHPVTGEPRFIMLQTVREYALERLDEAGEGAAVRGRHAMHVLNRVEAPERAQPAHRVRWLAAVEADHPDMRAAVDWADRSGDVDLLLRLAAGLGPFWCTHCHFTEGRRWLDRALGLSAGHRTAQRAELLQSAAYIARARGEYDAARAQYSEALSIREELGEVARIAEARRFLGNVAYDQGDLDGAEQWWQRSLASVDGTPHQAARMSVLNNLGVLAHNRGDDVEAMRRYDAALDLASAVDSADDQARALMNKAVSLGALGRDAEAERCAAQAVAMYAKTEDTWDLVDALEVLAGAVGRCGRPEAAGWLFGGAAGLRAALDVRRPVSETAEQERAWAAARAAAPDDFDRGYAEGARASLATIVERAGDGGDLVATP